MRAVNVDSRVVNVSQSVIHRSVPLDHPELAKAAPGVAIPDGAHGVWCAGSRGKCHVQLAIIADAQTSPLRLREGAHLALEAALHVLAFEEQCQSLEFWKERAMAAVDDLARERRDLHAAQHELNTIEDALRLTSTSGAAETKTLREAIEALTYELAEQRALVKRLGLRMFSAIDEERTRIARDLHDDQAQLLAAARIALEAGPEKSRPIFQRLEDELRRKVRELRPAALGRLTLRQALTAELKRASDAGFVTRLAIRAGAGKTSRSAGQLCFHVAREAISNVIRHARGSRVEIVVERSHGSVVISISDDGVGIASAKSDGSGLVGLRERVELMGGRVMIESGNNGTHVTRIDSGTPMNESTHKIRVMLADDHRILRDALKLVLSGECEIVAEAANGEEAVALATKTHPHVAIVDLAMPGTGGLAAAHHIARNSPETKVLILSQYDDEEYVLEAFSEAGVAGYLVKTDAADELLSAVKAVHAGRRYLSPSIAPVVLAQLRRSPSERASKGPALTRREREVLKLVAEGATVKEIAKRLGISPKTAQVHRDNFKQKLEVRSTAAMVRWAIEHKIVHIDRPA